MTPRIVVLGAGFGGLELTTMLSEALGDDVDVTLIDQNDGFVFGFSNLDVIFHNAPPDAVRLPYREFIKPGVRFRQEMITAIDPERRIVTTDGGTYEADVLVIALGSDYDFDATPGLAEGGNEFYSVPGAIRLRDVLADFPGGRVVIGVSTAPFKCPPAPSEAALMLNDMLTTRGIRDISEITIVLPFRRPVPPSPETSDALVTAFAERGITFIPERRVSAINMCARAAVLDDGAEVPFDVFMGVPAQRAPDVVAAAGMTQNGYVPVDPQTLATRYPGVYAVGDVATQGTPKAGVFAEGAARTVASGLIAEFTGTGDVQRHTGRGSCYIEFGAERIARVDVDFLSGPDPSGTFQAPSAELRVEKQRFGASRRARWFGRTE
jgi:sulfide:quinone oxidoreductase